MDRNVDTRCSNQKSKLKKSKVKMFVVDIRFTRRESVETNDII